MLQPPDSQRKAMELHQLLSNWWCGRGWFGGLVCGLVVWWFGGLVVWWFGGLVVWWFGGLVVWWFGGLVVWWFGDLQFALCKSRGFTSPNQRAPNHQLRLT